MSIYGNCPCCDKLIILTIEVVKDYNYFKCSNCCYEYYSPILSGKLVVNSKLYREDSDYINDLVISGDYNDLIQWNHLRSVRFLKNNKNINTVLDIGTYNGFFVKYLRDIGFEAYGYDFNEDAIRYGIRNYDLYGIITSRLSDLKIEKFDCITTFEVIEHLENPHKFISQWSNLLKHGGYLILSCPNNKMLWRPPLDYPPHHLSRYSPTSLSALLGKFGYEIVMFDEQMSLFDLIRNFAGVYFRDKNIPTLKGGQFKEFKIINYLKIMLNKSRLFFCVLFFPFDKLLHYLGFRYISQVIIAKNMQKIPPAILNHKV